MPGRNEQIVLDYLALFHADDPDFDALQAMLATSARYVALVPAVKPVIGAANIRAALEKQYQTYHDCDCEIHLIGSTGSHVFTERSDHVTLHHDGRRVSSRVCAVFEIDGDGRIADWREYWDSNDVLDQMGVSREVLDAAMN
jgi:limonene-1,2-epoxide hydrolase